VLVLGTSAILGSVCLLRRTKWPSGVLFADNSSSQQTIGMVLVIAWWLGISFATPYYTPYPRLMIPWLLATWLLSAVCWDEIVYRLSAVAKWPVTPRESGPLVLPILLVALVFAALMTRSAWKVTSAESTLASEDRAGLVQTADALKRALDQSATSRAIYVYGEPALLFQLKAAGEPFVGPVQEIPTVAVTAEGREMPTYLVVGPHARRDPQFQSAWHNAKSRWELITSFDYQPSAMVWLDLFDPRKVDPGDQAGEVVAIYRLR